MYVNVPCQNFSHLRLSFWLVFPISCPYFCPQTENVNLATIMNLCCFNLYVFVLLSFIFLYLDNASWIREGELSGRVGH